ncbi:hypothetical protein [Flammeovirga sp. EKP202]|uniref:hypothetical protein n=1 Tax=Flammeovirga sp. EKP202 TaxID=2770592 RepID=UPI00165F3481|nr:hypothetical protein [Flammeovirga sp. EKP202]MBD0402918.1 hypothetical protein [Flammeovirga sp. EKP202]
MRLTKEEKTALEDLKRVIDSCINGNDIRILTSQNNRIKRVLGVDLKGATLRKKEVKELKRGKDNFKIIIQNTMGITYPDTYGYFPFQVKKRK